MKNFLCGVLFSLMLSAGLSAQSVPDAPTPKIPTDAQVQDRGPAHTNPYENQPHDLFWDNHRPSDKHFWFINAEAYVSTAAPLLGGLRCRHRNGVEPCTSHYGAFYQAWAWTSAIEMVGGTAAYHICRKDNHNSKKCDLIQHVVTALNVGWGIHEARINQPDTTP
jgi:hypothetical protein